MQKLLASCQQCSLCDSNIELTETTRVNDGYLWRCTNRPFSKMAAENLTKSKLKTNNSTRKSTLTLVTLPSFSNSGEISAEKMYVEN